MSSGSGRIVLRHRLAAELSQERLAATAGVHRNHLSLIERGKHLPNLALIHRLSSAFGLPMSAMMAQVEAEEGRQDEPPPLPRWRPRKEVKAAGPGGRKRK